MSNQTEGADLHSKPETAEQKKKKKKKMKTRRRFSDEQIRLLESIFESETKLAPKKKLQIAAELGLQPRQVSIWFQNRRARWKAKQVEQNYAVLRANYDKLASCFDSLKNQRQSLLLQLQNLNKLLGQPCEGNTAIIGSDHEGNLSNEAEAKREVDKMSDEARQVVTNSDDCPAADGSLASPDQWHSFDSQWFNFWT